MSYPPRHPCTKLPEEAEAIGWYEQRLAVEPDAQAQAIMADAQAEEFKYFGMDLEFLLRRTPKWMAALEAIFFREGGIVEHGEEGEKAEERAWALRAVQVLATDRVLSLP